MKGSKSSGNQINLGRDEQLGTSVAEQLVIDIVDSSFERDVQNILVATEQSLTCQPTCSTKEQREKLVQPLKKTAVRINPDPELESINSVSPETSHHHECLNHTHIFESHTAIEQPLHRDQNTFSLSTYSIINPDLFNDLENIQDIPTNNAPPAYPVEVPVPSAQGPMVSVPVTRPPPAMRGPPPSYSKSLLDRRINPCASIQFVAPIPPPSYDGMDNELRYTQQSGFTLGLGNTWQSQPQPAYCPVCETVIITRIEVHISRMAHVLALVMCLMLCWPFCLLPYFLNVCNYTFHFCSVCQWYLGTRRPFQRT